MVLALLSFCGGWLNAGGRFDRFLSPVFEVGKAEPILQGPVDVPNHSTEYLLMGVSLAAAALGLYLAYLLYYKRRDLPQKIADTLGGFYETVVNKYYIDEIYAVLFVKPLIDGSTRILWHGVDQGVIDAAINDAAGGANHLSDAARHMQSGNLRSYAGWIAAGGAVVIAYMIWIGVR
jgi:NADH-quinone oxidoreductase subunit L